MCRAPPKKLFKSSDLRDRVIFSVEDRDSTHLQVEDFSVEEIVDDPEHNSDLDPGALNVIGHHAPHATDAD